MLHAAIEVPLARQENWEALQVSAGQISSASGEHMMFNELTVHT
jgi:hypothetical protein